VAELLLGLGRSTSLGARSKSDWLRLQRNGIQSKRKFWYAVFVESSGRTYALAGPKNRSGQVQVQPVNIVVRQVPEHQRRAIRRHAAPYAEDARQAKVRGIEGNPLDGVC
jgi:hypothetical protein